MRMTWLADVLREEGLIVVEVDGWRSRGRDDFSPISVFMHHTASTSGATPSLHICTYGRAGIAGPLCQVLVGRDGKVYVIASGRANHAGRGGPYGRIPKDAANRYSVGIEIEHRGTAAEEWQPQIMEVAERAAAAIARKLNAPDELSGVAHFEWAPGRKVDPYGWNMSAFRARVKATRGRHGRPRVVTAVLTSVAAVAAVLGITVSQLVAVNPGLDVATPVPAGRTITVPPAAATPTPAPAPGNPVVPIAPAKPAYPPVPLPPAGPPAAAPPAAQPVKPPTQVTRPTQALGSRGVLVERVQRAVGVTEDGKFGPVTERAVKVFQRRYGLDDDGRVGPRTWAVIDRVLSQPATGPGDRVLRLGSRGADVAFLQRWVGVDDDGKFGPVTERAVKRYQRLVGLDDDGVVGPRTWRRIGF